jgi:hypothetical protein
VLLNSSPQTDLAQDTARRSARRVKVTPLPGIADSSRGRPESSVAETACTADTIWDVCSSSESGLKSVIAPCPRCARLGRGRVGMPEIPFSARQLGAYRFRQ